MRRYRTLRNSKGREAAPRNLAHLRIMAKLELKRELFMSPRDQHRYFESRSIDLGRWRRMSNWLNDCDGVESHE